jgi:NAD(P) transhydrogenase subunit beta
MGVLKAIDGIYLLAAVGFLLSLQGLSSLRSAFQSNVIGVVSMTLVLGAAAFFVSFDFYAWAVIVAGIGAFLGALIARRVAMTSLPQLMAAFHSLVGLAAVFLGIAVFCRPEIIGFADTIPLLNLFEIGLGTSVGGVTFTGSVVAFLKLQGHLSRPAGLWRLCYQPVVRYGAIAGLLLAVTLFVAESSMIALMWVVGLSFLVGVTLVVPIGGADMPVVVSMLNSYSGWAAAGIGFTLDNFLLVIVGALVGASGAFLSYVMCQGMNRPFWQVIFGGSGAQAVAANSSARPFKQGGAADAAFLMKSAQSVLIVPGYGMAVAKAQHAIKEMIEGLKEAGVKVRFAIHPVAGRMPGHMNVLLAEADIAPEDVLELEEINADFGQTDVVLVVGANDITNPSARTDKTSPLYGMPILNVDKAGTVLFVKRSMGAGYAGVDNPLFYNDKTLMLLGDGKGVVEGIVKALPAA